MNEKSTGESKHQQADLDTRLKAYFGPELREQPLSSLSWTRLRSRLGRRRVLYRPFVQRWRLRRIVRRFTLPNDVLDAYTGVLDAARLYYPLAFVRCAFSFRHDEPRVRVVPFGASPIRLRLPSPRRRTLQRSELLVLLATGLARYSCLRERPRYVVVAIMFIFAGLVACGAAVAGWLAHRYGFALLLLVWPVIIGYVHVMKRMYARRADDVMVLWLGRSQVCQGLHSLAHQNRAANRRRWGQLTLAERIERICGTSVEARDERLTLVR